MLEAIALVAACTMGVVALLLWAYAERWRLLRPSTWRLLQAQGIKNILNFKAIHSYIYLRWTRQYVSLLRNYILPKLDYEAKKDGTEKYHGKVVTHEHIRAVITLNHPVQLRDENQILPYSTARDIVLTASPDIVAHECPCRHSRHHPCSPTQVCMIIGKPFTDFMLEHHPKTTRNLTQVEALELLKQEHERGHVHSAWFRDINLNRFYAICNCCKCCCTGVEALNTYGVPSLAASGYIAKVNTSDCTACGRCKVACPFEAIEVETAAAVQWDRCMGCGVCVSQCPTEAITLRRDEKKGVPFDVRLMTTYYH